MGPVVADDPIRQDVDLGGICQGLRWVDTETWAVTRTADGPQFPSGVTLRLSVVDIQEPPVASYEIFLTDDTIVLPADWVDQPVDGSVTSLPDWWQYDYALTGRIEGGTGQIVVTWGVTVDGGPMTTYRSTLSIAVGAPCPPEEPTPTPDATPTPVASPRPTARIIDLAAVLEVPKADRFERFGAEPLRFHSVWSPRDLGLGGTCDATDSWLECDLEDWLIQPLPDWGGASLGLFFGSGVRERLVPELRAGEGPLDVTGHFGDQASEDCGPEARDACRDQFVVTVLTRGPVATPPATTTTETVEPVVRPPDATAVLVLVLVGTAIVLWRLTDRRTRAGRAASNPAAHVHRRGGARGCDVRPAPRNW